MELKDQKRKGVFPEHQGQMFMGGGTFNTGTRMTIPAKEALQKVAIIKEGDYYFQKAPTNLIPVLVPNMETVSQTPGFTIGLRCTNEPPFPGEEPCNNLWVLAELANCPQCGHALVWYEAGYVPGYRVCAGPEHHHYIVAA